MVLLLCCILSCEIKFQVPVVRRHFIQFDVKTMYNFYFLNSTRISATEKLFLPSSSFIYIILLAGFSFHFPQTFHPLSTVQSVRLAYAGQCTYLRIRPK